MNYIKQLEQERADLQDLIVIREVRMQQFREHLLLPKFTQPASDGSRTDWISTADVMQWLAYIETPN